MIVLTITDTNTQQAIAFALTPPVANAVFGGAEVALDDADPASTGFEEEQIASALDVAVRAGQFTRFAWRS